MSQILTIQPIYPLPGSTISLPSSRSLNCTVQITLGCGCPTCHRGRWDASRFRVKASILNDRSPLSPADDKIPFTYSGRISEFCGTFNIEAPGNYTVVITAQDPETGISGRTTMHFRINRP